MFTVAVIIPYFQKKAGILKRALVSVLQQQIPPGVSVDIIVIDDGSPHPSKSEIAGLNAASPFRLKIIEQANGGVAAARNTGLGSVSEDTKYISFLDSDDYWEPIHLSHALSSLEKGYDFYFCNNCKKDHHDSYFSQAKFDDYLNHKGVVVEKDNLIEIDKNALIDFSLRSWASMTSTIVYRKSICPNLTFNTSMKVAGEDCLFFLRIMTECIRICCSPNVEVTHADGVNIYYSKFSWDSPGHLVRHMGNLLMCHEMQLRLPLSDGNKKYMANRIKSLRKHFTYLTLRYLIKKRELWPKELFAMTREDGSFWIWYPLYIPYVIFLVLTKKLDPLEEEGDTSSKITELLAMSDA